jgi:hypothetical protein
MYVTVDQSDERDLLLGLTGQWRGKAKDKRQKTKDQRQKTKDTRPKKILPLRRGVGVGFKKTKD